MRRWKYEIRTLVAAESGGLCTLKPVLGLRVIPPALTRSRTPKQERGGRVRLCQHRHDAEAPPGGLQSQPVSDPIPQKLLNDCDHDGAFLCPECQQPIALNIGVKFVGAYALHIACRHPDDRARAIDEANGILQRSQES